MYMHIIMDLLVCAIKMLFALLCENSFDLNMRILIYANLTANCIQFGH